MENKTFSIGNIRPPFHADSLLLQITENCTWNKCNFCTLYKGGSFKMHTMEKIKSDIDAVAFYRDKIMEKHGDMTYIMNEYSLLDTEEEKMCYSMVFNWMNSDKMKTVFLQDANTSSLKTDFLEEMLIYLRQKLPSLETVACYGRADTLILKSEEEFKRLKKAGLTMLHSGYESGCDEVLKLINKGITQEEEIEVGKRIKNAGIEFNVFYMPGSGGKRLSHENAIETAKVINSINPEFIRIRTFVVKQNAPMWNIAMSDEFEECGDIEKLMELREMIEHIENVNSFLISDHIINLLPRLEGHINTDKQKMLDYIDGFLSLPKQQQMEFQLARRMCYGVDYTDMHRMREGDMSVIRDVIKKISSESQWEEVLRKYLRRYI